MLKKKIASIIEPVQRTCEKCGTKHTINPKTKYLICSCGEKIYEEESGLQEKDSGSEQTDSK